jgi:hypothetical protein
MHGIIIAHGKSKPLTVSGETGIMKPDRILPWDGVERRKRERRSFEVRRCCSCNSCFPARDILNLCPDCVRKMMLLYEKNQGLPAKT